MRVTSSSLSWFTFCIIICSVPLDAEVAIRCDKQTDIQLVNNTLITFDANNQSEKSIDCLLPTQKHGERCWITKQCDFKNGLCWNLKLGQLNDLNETLWLQATSNNSHEVISIGPGICRCPNHHVYVQETKICVHGHHLKSCLMDIECYLVHGAKCINNNCGCDEDHVFMANESKCAPVRSNSKEVTCIGAECHLKGQTGHKHDASENMIGFLYCVGLIILIWATCWCCRRRKKRRKFKNSGLLEAGQIPVIHVSDTNFDNICERGFFDGVMDGMNFTPLDPNQEYNNKYPKDRYTTDFMRPFSNVQTRL